MNIPLLVLAAGLAANPQLEEVVRAHDASVAAIDSISCSVIIRSLIPEDKENESDTTYARSGQARRITKLDSRSTTEWYIVGNTCSQYAIRGGIASSGQIRANYQYNWEDVSLHALMRFSSPSHTYQTLQEMFTADVKLVTKSLPGGLVSVSYRVDSQTYELDIDPSKNYLVVSRHSYPTNAADNTPDHTDTVEDFMEPAPGILFPHHVRGVTLRSGKTQHDRRVTFDNVKVNSPLGDLSKTFRFPKGVRVGDEIRDQVFIADSEGRLEMIARTPSGTPITLGRDPPLDLSRSGGKSLQQTAEEPPSRTAWWFAGLGVLLCLAGVIWMKHRDRSITTS